MASIETRKWKKKTTYRVKYYLWIDGKKTKPPERESFDDPEDAKDFLAIAEVIEIKSKRNLASPAEVALY